MTTGENAMMEGNMQNITSTGSYLTWCNDKVVALAILVAIKSIWTFHFGKVWLTDKCLNNLAALGY